MVSISSQRMLSIGGLLAKAGGDTQDLGSAEDTDLHSSLLRGQQ